MIAALGHSDATYEQTVAGIEAGGSVATHLYNAMPPLHHRDPGPIAALLEDERVTVELINDGVHAHPAMVRLAYDVAGPGRTALITDAMAAAGAGDGVYGLGTMKVDVTDGVARLAEGGSIAGSTLTMDVAFRRAVREVGLSLSEAAEIASLTPARGSASPTAWARSRSASRPISWCSPTSWRSPGSCGGEPGSPSLGEVTARAVPASRS